MKKKLLIFTLLFSIVSLFFLCFHRGKNIIVDSSKVDSYLTNHEFNFIKIHTIADPYAMEAIEAMLHQDYDNFHIYVIIHKNELFFKSKVEVFTKKENNTHLISFIEIDDDIYTSLIVKDLVDKLSKESFVVYLEEGTFLSSFDTLKKLNNYYLINGNKSLIYTNFKHYPSYQKNLTPLDFLSSPFKAFSVNHLVNSSAYSKDLNSFLGVTYKDEEPFYLDEPLYLKTR